MAIRTGIKDRRSGRQLAWLGALMLAVALALAACVSMSRGSGLFGTYRNNGERIYFSGISANDQIGYSGGNIGGMMGSGGMMGGGRLACVDCHGADARGGEHVMHMTVMNAPDIRWSTLTNLDGEGHDGEGHAMEHDPYTAETFARAVRDGVDPAGQPLDASMPRWRMSDQDLTDLIQYLQLLP